MSTCRTIWRHTRHCHRRENPNIDSCCSDCLQSHGGHHYVSHDVIQTGPAHLRDAAVSVQYNTFRKLWYCHSYPKPCHGSSGQSPASHRKILGSIPEQSNWDLWRKKWHWDRGFLQLHLSSPVSTTPLILHTNLQLHVFLTRRTNVRSLESFEKNRVIS